MNFKINNIILLNGINRLIHPLTIINSSRTRIANLYISSIMSALEDPQFPVFSQKYADEMDKRDPLSSFRSEFIFPPAPSTSGRDKVVYLCGNSLGLQPVKLKENLTVQLDKWGTQGVEGHFEQPTPWLTIDDIVQESAAKLVGAQRREVVVMNTLTSNLHFMMSSFYTPTQERFKIITEKKAFPSDTHAVYSQILHHGFDPATALIEVAPREGEDTLRREDIVDVIKAHGSTTALVMFSGVQYYTGQFFDLKLITEVGHAHGCVVGFDLAHAVGNVPLQLHDWGCDFAVWCSYKYLNCGPGSIAGAFVHENAGTVSIDANGVPTYKNRLSGWWGHRVEDRFIMAPEFIPEPGAYGFRLSNPSVLLVACVRTSLDLFDAAGMDRLRQKSILLTNYLEKLLLQEVAEHVSIITPSTNEDRGCQLSICFKIDLDEAMKKVAAAGVMCDVRRPNVMRIAPAPLYNSFRDVFDFVSILKTVL